MTTRALLVAALYVIAIAATVVAIVDRIPALLIAGFALMAVAGAVYARGEQLNAREMARLRRTGWRLQDDITRLERELGIKGDA